MTAPFIFRPDNFIFTRQKPIDIRWHLTQPFVNPPNSFRASSVREMVYVVPQLFGNQSFSYEVGVPNTFRTQIFSFRNRSVNTGIRVTMRLPSYLRVNVQMPFYLAPMQVNYSTGVPISVDTQSTVNITVSFNESFAKSQIPNVFLDRIEFDIDPIGVAEPVFIDRSIQPPPNLNGVDDIPVVGAPAATGSQPQYIVVPEPIILPPVPGDDTPKLFWKDGTTGEIKPGTPPERWIIAADGAAYPPFGETTQCNPTQVGPGDPLSTDPATGTIMATFNTDELKQMLHAIQNLPLKKAGAKRVGITLDPSALVTLVNTPFPLPTVFFHQPYQTIRGIPQTMAARLPSAIIADVGPALKDFTIIRVSQKTISGGTEIGGIELLLSLIPTTVKNIQEIVTNVRNKKINPPITSDKSLNNIATIAAASLFQSGNKLRISEDIMEILQLVGVQSAVVGNLDELSYFTLVTGAYVMLTALKTYRL